MTDRYLYAVKVLSLLFLLFIGAVILWLPAEITHQSATNQLDNEASNALGVYVANLASELNKYEALPSIFAEYPLFRTLLHYPDNQVLLDQVNTKLLEFNRHAGALDTYLINAEGITVAASNWASSISFIGEDLSFRPYFINAMKGQVSRYFALGTTSGKRGYYFAAPIAISQSELKNVLGVVVIKVDLASLEKAWKDGGALVAVTDQDAVVFITTKNEWLYKSLSPLTTTAIERIRTSRRYGNHMLDAIPTERENGNDNKIILKIKEDDSARTQRYIQHSRAMPDREWTVHSFSSLSVVEKQVSSAVLISLLSTLLFALACVIAYLKYLSKEQDRQVERKMKNALEESNCHLEVLVQERTKALSHTNSQLMDEIAERRHTSNKLLETQDQLVQAAKMAALGKMATSITHELNQPLAAIRSFAENGVVYIQRNKTDKALTNLKHISSMASRMKDIMQHLKSFARKTPMELTPVSVNSVISDTFLVLHSAINKSGVKIIHNQCQPDIFVSGEPVRLQQVLTNLLQNSLDAMADTDHREIKISIQNDLDQVNISIEDSGPGIPVDAQDKLFDPFYSEKKAGSGLGLGLSISYSIMQAFGGQIVANNADGGGAIFTIQLQRVLVKEVSYA